MEAGEWRVVPLASGERGAVQIIAVGGPVVGIRVGAARWGCDPGPLDLAGLDVVADHVPCWPRGWRASLVGRTAVPAGALDGGYALWVQAGPAAGRGRPLEVMGGPARRLTPTPGVARYAGVQRR
ncbi:MAG: hypothetical protein R3F43_04660 [bacterium]